MVDHCGDAFDLLHRVVGGRRCRVALRDCMLSEERLQLRVRADELSDAGQLQNVLRQARD